MSLRRSDERRSRSVSPRHGGARVPATARSASRPVRRHAIALTRRTVGTWDAQQAGGHGQRLPGMRRRPRGDGTGFADRKSHERRNLDDLLPPAGSRSRPALRD